MFCVLRLVAPTARCRWQCAVQRRAEVLAQQSADLNKFAEARSKKREA